MRLQKPLGAGLSHCLKNSKSLGQTPESYALPVRMWILLFLFGLVDTVYLSISHYPAHITDFRCFLNCAGVTELGSQS